MDPGYDANQVMYGEDYGEPAYYDEPLPEDSNYVEESEEADPDACTCDPCDCDCNPPGAQKKSIRGSKPLMDDEYEGEGEGDLGCTCDPCECETPPGSREKTMTMLTEAVEESEMVDTEVSHPYQLDEFTRAKAFFMNTSTKSGISLYDHLSDVIRKLLDERAPTNAVDFLEEISMNVKRYRFQQPKDVLQDVFYISEPVLNDARFLNDNWKQYAQWSDEAKEIPGEGFVAGGFQNLLRLQYYLEQVNIGLPREEMFRLALSIKDLTANRPYITKARFWGKIFCSRKNYYVVEADINSPGNSDADLWQPQEESQNPESVGGAGDAGPQENIPGAQATFEKAGNVVLNSDVLSAYSKTSGLPPEEQANLLPKTKAPTPPSDGGLLGEGEWGGEDAGKSPEDAEAAADFAKWQGYQEELMTKFPTPNVEVEVEIPPESDGTGANRRAFYVCNILGQPWVLLPPASPKQINGARQIRWGLTGELDGNIRSFPNFPGKEGHLLKAMLTRASAGSLVSPKGFYRGNSYPSEYEGEDDEDIEEEEESMNPPGDDKVTAVKKYRPPMDSLTNPKLTFWVHHACLILPQGRNVWWNPLRAKKRGDETEDEEEEEEDEGEEYEGEDGNMGPTREVGPPLFTPISTDVAPDGKAPWTLQTSSSVFKEFQVVSVRSNTWPGSTVVCTIKGKVDNIYLGDGQKFADRSYAPFMHENVMREYRIGPEIEEFPDPSVEEEQKWLNRLEMDELGDIEPPFVDNEEGYEEMEEAGEYSDED